MERWYGCDGGMKLHPEKGWRQWLADKTPLWMLIRVLSKGEICRIGAVSPSSSQASAVKHAWAAQFNRV